MRRRKRKNKQIKFIMITSLSLLFILTVGYAAFQTNINITAKGNIIKVTFDDLTKHIVTTGDGIYKDIYEEGRYVYKGKEPSNYIIFNDEMWRILAIESDGTLKISSTTLLEEIVWDTNYSNDWKSSTINEYLNNTYYSALSEKSKSQIQNHSWNVGGVHYDIGSLSAMITEEKSTVWNGNVGLMSVSDYYKSNSNIEQCGDFDSELNNNSDGFCKKTSFLFSMIENSTNNLVWMISPCAKNSNYVWFMQVDQGYAGVEGAQIGHSALPVVYLKSNITLKGKGTQTNPYIINP